MTRIRLKRERETLDAAGFAWSNPMCMRQGLCYKYQAIGIAGSNNFNLICAEFNK